MRRFLAVLSLALLRALVAPGCDGQPLCAQDLLAGPGAGAAQAASAGPAASASQAAGVSAGAAPAQNLAQYQGQYRDTSDPDQVHAIYVDGGVLYEDSEQRQPQRLIPDPESADRFCIEASGAHVLFLRDESRAIYGLRVVLDRDGSTLAEANRFSKAATRLNHYRAYSRHEAMLPMRDGVRLHAVILRPEQVEAGDVLPFLIDRTPYGVDGFDSQSVNLYKPELAASGYIFVFEDIRGRYKSEGQFVMNRPVVSHDSKSDVDETTDAHDTIDWLLKNVPDNIGRVGVAGSSYDGFLAMMAGIDGHPALKAISPQAPMTDVWMGDDFFHNGAFRETYGFDYVQQMESQKTDVRVNSKQDVFDFFLQQRNFASAAETAKMSDLNTAKAFLTEPAYTKFWQNMAVEGHLAQVHVPTLEVGGFWDQEDMWGTQAEYAALKQHDSAHEVFLVLGPWNHGGWETTGRKLGADFGRLDFGEPTEIEFRKTMEAPFFEKYLKDRPGFDLADTASFRTGVNRWERYAAWPPVEGFAAARLYLEPGQRLGFAAPAGGPAARA